MRSVSSKCERINIWAKKSSKRAKKQKRPMQYFVWSTVKLKKTAKEKQQILTAEKLQLESVWQSIKSDHLKMQCHFVKQPCFVCEETCWSLINNTCLSSLLLLFGNSTVCQIRLVMKKLFQQTKTTDCCLKALVFFFISIFKEQTREQNQSFCPINKC